MKVMVSSKCSLGLMKSFSALASDSVSFPRRSTSSLNICVIPCDTLCSRSPPIYSTKFTRYFMISSWFFVPVVTSSDFIGASTCQRSLLSLGWRFAIKSVFLLFFGWYVLALFLILIFENVDFVVSAQFILSSGCIVENLKWFPSGRSFYDNLLATSIFEDLKFVMVVSKGS